MMLESREGTFELADPLVVAVARHAEFVADLTAEALKQMFPEEPLENLRLPANSLLELGAVLQISNWEMHGIFPHIEAGLPSKAEASRRLSERAHKGASEFEGENATAMHEQVLRFWIDNFAWDGPSLLNANIVLGEVDEDQFLDLAADFLWQYRQELKSLLTLKEEDDGKKTV